MPTGYTAGIIDGDGITPREFLLRCARAFGAAIMQREDRMDAPLKTVVEPSDYHEKALARANLRLRELATMEDVERSAAVALKAAQNLRAERQAAIHMESKRYEDMLAEVRKWEPPTDGHRKLKEFAIEQIAVSMDRYDVEKVDVSAYEPEAWHASQVMSANRDLAYHTEELSKEIARCKERTEWLTAFARSLPEDD